MPKPSSQQIVIHTDKVVTTNVYIFYNNIMEDYLTVARQYVPEASAARLISTDRYDQTTAALVELSGLSVPRRVVIFNEQPAAYDFDEFIMQLLDGGQAGARVNEPDATLDYGGRKYYIFNVH